jgi:hypothetical protein
MGLATRIALRALVKASAFAGRLSWNREGTFYRLGKRAEMALCV